MIGSYTTWLALGAALSAIAGLLHLCIVVGGAPWYRFFGAGERMARAAQAGKRYPALVTLAIALVLFICAAYALSGAGLIAPLPLLKFALIAISTVYMLRGLIILPLMVVAADKMTPFALWSSLICLAYGIVHVVGLTLLWPSL